MVILSASGIVTLTCLIVIGTVGVFASQYQPLNAGGLTASELAPVRSIGGGQLQAVEKTARSTDKLAASPSIWPAGGEVTSGFGWRNSPFGGGRELHQGIDIANSMGTPIVATADGTVVQSGWAGGYGNIVQLDHGNGMVTVYGHNSRVAVNVGQGVQKGQVISYMGSTGQSTGPHVHYEVRVNGAAVDPISYLVQY